MSGKPPRIIVRRFVSSDLDDFLSYQGLPEVRRFVGGPMTRDQAEQFLLGQRSSGDGRGGAWHGFAVERVLTGKVIGDVGLMIQIAPAGTCDLGVQFHPKYWGKGYAFEAATVVLDLAFSHLKIERVTAACSRGNQPWQRLLVRLGMQQDLQSYPGRLGWGESHEETRFFITREEWLDRRR